MAYRASCTRGVFVHTFDPGIAGIALRRLGSMKAMTVTKCNNTMMQQV